MLWSRTGKAASRGVLDVYTCGQGLVVQGTTTDVAAFIDEITASTKAARGQGRRLIVDGAIVGVQVAANAVAHRQTHREYFEFSPNALARIKAHGAIPTEDGWFRSFVHDGKGFAGNLDWKPVKVSPEQALGMQAMAGQMALRAAIKDVIAAIERVEDKIDRIAALANAERLGAVVADRATLLPIVERLRSTRQLSNTDWTTIASLGPWIARDIESLRTYIDQQLKKVDDSWMVRKRASGAEDLTDQLVRESLALLIVAEQNYALWQELRIGHASVNERDAVQSICNDVRHQLMALSREDQNLVHHFTRVIHRLVAPTGYEGLAPLKKQQLKEYAKNLTSMRTWFADQRHLDYDEAELPDYPGLGESLSKVWHYVSTTVQSVTDGKPDSGPMTPSPGLPAPNHELSTPERPSGDA